MHHFDFGVKTRDVQVFLTENPLKLQDRVPIFWVDEVISKVFNSGGWKKEAEK